MSQLQRRLLTVVEVAVVLLERRQPHCSCRCAHHEEQVLSPYLPTTDTMIPMKM